MGVNYPTGRRVLLGVCLLGLAGGVFFAGSLTAPSHTTYRIPVACTRAAQEATAVITHNRGDKPLIDRLTGPYQTRYAHRPLVINDGLPAFDGRVPDLAVCGGG